MPGCAAYGCSNSDKKGFLMKVFPRDPARRAIWAEKVRRDQWEPTDSTHLCEAHFTADQWEKTRVDGTRKLKFNAVPTLFSYIKISRKKKRLRSSSPQEKQHQVPLEKQAIEPEFAQHVEHNYGKNHFQDAAIKRAKRRKYRYKKSILLAKRQLRSSVQSSVPLEETTTQSQGLNSTEHNDASDGAAEVVVVVEQSAIIPSKKRKLLCKKVPSPRKKLKMLTDTSTSVEEQNLEPSAHQNGSSNATDIIEGVEHPITKQPNKRKHQTQICPLSAEQHKDSVETSVPVEELQDGSNHATIITVRLERPACNDSSTQTDSEDVAANDRIKFLETKLRDFEKYAAKLQGKVNALGLKLRAKVAAEHRQRNTPKSSIEERLSSIFTEDQISRLQCGKKNMKWSSESIQMASALKSNCGKKGYKHLLDLGMPFPSFRTLRRMKQTAPEENFSAENAAVIVLQNLAENTIFHVENVT